MSYIDVIIESKLTQKGLFAICAVVSSELEDLSARVGSL